MAAATDRHSPSLLRELPHSLEAEEHLLSSCQLDGGETLSKAREAGIDTGAFYDPRHGRIYATLCMLADAGRPIDVSVVAEELKASGQLEAVGGIPYLTQVSSRIPTTAQAHYFIQRVRELSLLRDTVRSAQGVMDSCYDFSGGSIDEFLTGVRGRLVGPLDQYQRSAASVLETLMPRRAGAGRTIAPSKPTFYLKGVPVFTRGNIGVVTAFMKEGKSGVIGAAAGAAMAGNSRQGDTLGFTADNADGHAVLHLDTEQCAEDHEKLFNTARRRAGDCDAPPWFYSYGVKGIEPKQLLWMLDRLLREVNRIHGGVYAVFLDGIADFVLDANDPKECNPVVTKLESIATEYDCSVVVVLHLNPSPTKQPTKSRGHLGSQLERKCEVDLRLTKDADGITTIYTACARRAPILEKDGLRFSWDHQANMHTALAGTAQQTRDSEKSERLREVAAEVWDADGGLKYTELISRLKAKCRITVSGAEQKFGEMRKLGVIEKAGFQWRITT